MFSDGGDLLTGWAPVSHYRLSNNHQSIMTDQISVGDGWQQLPIINEISTQTDELVLITTTSSSRSAIGENLNSPPPPPLLKFLARVEPMLSEALMENLSSTANYQLIDMRGSEEEEDAEYTNTQCTQLKFGRFKQVEIMPPPLVSLAINNDVDNRRVVKDLDSQGWLTVVAYGIDRHLNCWCDHSGSGEGGHLILWDNIRQRQLYSVPTECCLTRVLLWDEQVFAGTYHGSVLKWDQQGRQQHSTPTLTEPVRQLLYLSQPPRLVSVCGDGSVSVFSAVNLALITQFSIGEGVTAAALWPSPLQQDLLLVGTENGSLYRVPISSNNSAGVSNDRPKIRFTASDSAKRGTAAHCGPINMIISGGGGGSNNNNNNSIFATSAGDGTVKLWGMQPTPLRVLYFGDCIGLWCFTQQSNNNVLCIFESIDALHSDEDNRQLKVRLVSGTGFTQCSTVNIPITASAIKQVWPARLAPATQQRQQIIYALDADGFIWRAPVRIA
jgi:WD40 repeat protein